MRSPFVKFLSDRRQRVVVDVGASVWIIIASDVPRGKKKSN